MAAYIYIYIFIWCIYRCSGAFHTPTPSMSICMGHASVVLNSESHSDAASDLLHSPLQRTCCCCILWDKMSLCHTLYIYVSATSLWSDQTHLHIHTFTVCLAEWPQKRASWLPTVTVKTLGLDPPLYTYHYESNAKILIGEKNYYRKCI